MQPFVSVDKAEQVNTALDFQTSLLDISFEVSVVVIVQIVIFWRVIPCSLVIGN
jgi:hypothetical protein